MMSSIVADNQIAIACQIVIAKYSDQDIKATQSCRIPNSRIYNLVVSSYTGATLAVLSVPK